METIINALIILFIWSIGMVVGLITLIKFLIWVLNRRVDK